MSELAAPRRGFLTRRVPRSSRPAVDYAFELRRRDDAIQALRGRLTHLQDAYESIKRERTALQAQVRELVAYREDAERTAQLLADALREQRAALAALERALDV